ncbi:hypothetical protein WMF31_04150 [Sorangium sp. So ce1036]|uniref:hypothetical protein n=1 Tax=Sorangium sp. So ce1036 TaxID=3133328 RepID=UPI003F008110
MSGHHRALLRPGALASARAPKFGWKRGEELRADLFLLNDAPEGVAAGAVEARVVHAGGAVTLVRWSFPDLPPRRNAKGPTLSFVLPRFEGSTFRLELRVEGRPALDSSYTFAYADVAERRKPAPGERFLNGWARRAVRAPSVRADSSRRSSGRPHRRSRPRDITCSCRRSA